MKLTAPKIRKQLIGLLFSEACDMIENKMGLTVENDRKGIYYARYRIDAGPTKIKQLRVYASRIDGKVVNIGVAYKLFCSGKALASTESS